MKKLKSDIEVGAFEPVYLLYGPEAYLRRRLKGALREAVTGGEAVIGLPDYGSAGTGKVRAQEEA